MAAVNPAAPPPMTAMSDSSDMIRYYSLGRFCVSARKHRQSDKRLENLRLACVQLLKDFDQIDSGIKTRYSKCHFSDVRRPLTKADHVHLHRRLSNEPSYRHRNAGAPSRDSGSRPGVGSPRDSESGSLRRP